MGDSVNNSNSSVAIVDDLSTRYNIRSNVSNSVDFHINSARNFVNKIIGDSNNNNNSNFTNYNKSVDQVVAQFNLLQQQQQQLLYNNKMQQDNHNNNNNPNNNNPNDINDFHNNIVPLSNNPFTYSPSIQNNSNNNKTDQHNIDNTNNNPSNVQDNSNNLSSIPVKPEPSHIQQYLQATGPTINPNATHPHAYDHDPNSYLHNIINTNNPYQFTTNPINDPQAQEDHSANQAGINNQNNSNYVIDNGEASVDPGLYDPNSGLKFSSNGKLIHPCKLLTQYSKRPLRTLHLIIPRMYTLSKRDTDQLSIAQRQELLNLKVRIMGKPNEKELYFVAKDVCLLIHTRKGNVSKSINNFTSSEKARMPVECPRSNGTVSTHMLTLLSIQGLNRLLTASRSPLAPIILEFLQSHVADITKPDKYGKQLDTTFHLLSKLGVNHNVNYGHKSRIVPDYSNLAQIQVYDNNNNMNNNNVVTAATVGIPAQTAVTVASLLNNNNNNNNNGNNINLNIPPIHHHTGNKRRRDAFSSDLQQQSQPLQAKPMLSPSNAIIQTNAFSANPNINMNNNNNNMQSNIAALLQPKAPFDQTSNTLNSDRNMQQMLFNIQLNQQLLRGNNNNNNATNNNPGVTNAAHLQLQLLQLQQQLAQQQQQAAQYQAAAAQSSNNNTSTNPNSSILQSLQLQIQQQQQQQQQQLLAQAQAFIDNNKQTPNTANAMGPNNNNNPNNAALFAAAIQAQNIIQQSQPQQQLLGMNNNNNNNNGNNNNNNPLSSISAASVAAAAHQANLTDSLI